MDDRKRESDRRMLNSKINSPRNFVEDDFYLGDFYFLEKPAAKTKTRITAERPPERKTPEPEKPPEPPKPKKELKKEPKKKPKKETKKETKSGKAWRVALNIASVLLICLILYQLAQIAKYYYDNYQNDRSAEAAQKILSEYVVEPDAIAAFENENPDAPKLAPIADRIAPEAALSGDQLKSLETYGAAENNAEFIDRLRTEFDNDDIIGYIYIQGTSVSYPVVQSQDNDYYLKRSVKKESSVTGAIFADYECDFANFSSRNNVIYGHNMKNGAMFHDLRYFIERDYFNAHRYVIIKFPDRTTVWEIFAAYHTRASFNYTQVVFEDDEKFDSLLKKMRAKSYVITDAEVSTDDQILTLSTCTNAADDERMVVHAKLVNTIKATRP